MRNILDSKENFHAYATIEACYFYLEEIAKLIDECSIHDAEKLDDLINISIELMHQIIEAKKIIKADYKNELIAIEAICAV